MTIEESVCGRPTKSGLPCRNQIYGRSYRACYAHESPEDRVYRDGYEAGFSAALRISGHDREMWIAEGRRLAEQEASAARQARETFRDRTSDGAQIVEVDGYAYKWNGAKQLAIGDQVALPENWLSRVQYGAGSFRGTVTRIGTNYQGALSTVLYIAQSSAA